MKSAVERFWEAVPEQVEGKPVDGAILTSAANCRYLSGFPSSSRLVILTREQAYFLTDFRYGEAARKKVRDCQVVVFQRREQSVKEILRRHGLKTVLFERETIPLVEAETLGGLCREEGIAPIFDNTLDKTMESIRAIKTPEEIDKIRAAQAITDEAFSHILPFLREGVTEREIALEIEFFMRKQGAERIAFDLIVVSGENGSQCHGVPTDKPLRRGDFITMDTGAVCDGYHSDMTRTVALGEVSEEQRQVYDTVLRAQLAAIDTVRAGVHCHIVDRAARSIIEEKYPKAFGHGLGHSVGLEIHENPRFSPACEDIAQPGMVITVEPGIYLEGRFGVRIEDMILVTENGCENLTHSPKELLIV